MTTQPVSYQPVIDRAVEYVRSHPHSESATDVYRLLGEAFEDAGDHQRAILYYGMAGPQWQEKVLELKEKAARSLLQQAENSRSGEDTEAYLRGILNSYPESTASKEAAQKLAQRLKLENRGIRISKEFLAKNPELHGTEGLGLKAALFDGDLGNLELADRGINLLGNGEILFHFQTPWGAEQRTYGGKEENVARLKLRLRKRHYEMATLDVHTRPRGSLGGMKDLPVWFLERKGGAVDTEGERARLVKKADGKSPDSPKVLDYELLSENERDPESKFRLPPIRGSVSSSGFDVRGDLPNTFLGEEISFGTDAKSPFAGIRLGIPLLQDFIPVDFLLQGRPNRPSLIPQIRPFSQKEHADDILYR